MNQPHPILKSIPMLLLSIFIGGVFYDDGTGALSTLGIVLIAGPILAFAVAIYGSISHSKMLREREDAIYSLMLEKELEPDVATFLKDNQAAIMVFEESKTITALNYKGKSITWKHTELLGAEVTLDTETVITTKGKAAGVSVGGVLLGGGGANSTGQTITRGVWLRLFVDSIKSPTVNMPMKSEKDAQKWFGIVQALMNRKDASETNLCEQQ